MKRSFLMYLPVKSVFKQLDNIYSAGISSLGTEIVTHDNMFTLFNFARKS